MHILWKTTWKQIFLPVKLLFWERICFYWNSEHHNTCSLKTDSEGDSAVPDCSQFSCSLAPNASGRESNHRGPLPCRLWAGLPHAILCFREQGNKVAASPSSILASSGHSSSIYALLNARSVSEKRVVSPPLRKKKVSSCSLLGTSGLAAEYWTFCCFVLFTLGAVLPTWMSDVKLCLSRSSPGCPFSSCLQWSCLLVNSRSEGGPELIWKHCEVQNSPFCPHTRQHLLAGPSCWVTQLLRAELSASKPLASAMHIAEQHKYHLWSFAEEKSCLFV